MQGYPGESAGILQNCIVDEEGKFMVTGSDVNGQQVRLRSSDGVNMTEAGRRKLAFYVEKVARRHLSDAPATDTHRFR